MSLGDIITKELAEHLVELTVEDFRALVRASSLGLNPEGLYAGVQAIHRGEDFPLPAKGGHPHPIKVQAWSFVNDHGQYHDTYGLSSAQAGDLKDLLRTDTSDGVAQITKVVTDALRKRGSQRPVIVTTDGMPGSPSTDHSPQPKGGSNRAALAAEIARDPGIYGSYKFVPQDTGRTGVLRFRVRLGGGLYSVHASIKGASDTAKICRQHGRSHPLVADNVCFWLEGRAPLFGDDIPDRVTFDGRLPPNGSVPADPQVKEKTVAGPSRGNGKTEAE